MTSKDTKPKKAKLKKINVALQGGGSHGAFTWGVLDYLLEDGRFDIEGVSATSAGSMNAVIMAAGYMEGREDGAREYLRRFWKQVSEAGSVFCPVSTTVENPFASFMPKWMSPDWFGGVGKNAENSFMHMMSALAQNISPYQFNPMNLNPLRDILDDMVDFEALRKNKDFKLFITATNVRTGGSRIFTSPELTRDMVLASAALPNVFQAVEIDGEAYWDGGYVGNPSLWPLFYETEGIDLLIVHVNSIVQNELPKDAMNIEDRVNEITFNSAMLKEMRAIAFVQKLLERDMLKPEYRHKYKDVLMHAIRADTVMRDFGMTNKLDTSWPALTKLFEAGRKIAESWAKENFDKIGKESTINLEKDYLDIAVDKKSKVK
jgi:NTE family protein